MYDVKPFLKLLLSPSQTKSSVGCESFDKRNKGENKWWGRLLNRRTTCEWKYNPLQPVWLWESALPLNSMIIWSGLTGILWRACWSACVWECGCAQELEPKIEHVPSKEIVLSTALHKHTTCPSVFEFWVFRYCVLIREVFVVVAFFFFNTWT